MVIRLFFLLLFFIQYAAAQEHRLTFLHDGKEHDIVSWDNRGMLFLLDGEKTDVPADAQIIARGLTVEDWEKGLVIPRLGFYLSSDYSSTITEKEGFYVDWGNKVYTNTPPLLQQRLKKHPSLNERREQRIIILTLWDNEKLISTIVNRIRFSVDDRPANKIFEFLTDGKGFGKLQLFVFIYDFEHGLVDVNAGQGLPTFERALLLNDTQLMHGLLAGSENPNKLGLEGFAPVHLAATLSNEAARLLLTHKKAKLTQKDNEDWQPMHYAAARANIAAIEWLIAEKVKPDNVPDRENSPLHLAAKSGSEEAVLALLEAGANPHPRSPIKGALIESLDRGQDNMVRIMRGFTNNFSIDPKTSQWILHQHIRGNRVEIVRLILESTKSDLSELVKLEPPVILAAIRSGPAMMELLLKHGADINAISTGGHSALHIAATGNPSLIPWLLENGLDIEQRNNAGQTPLIMTVGVGNLSATRLLLDGGADANVTTAKGLHILEYAAALARNEIVSMLIQSGSVCEFNPESAKFMLEDAFYYDIPELVLMTVNQCIPIDFSFDGGFSGWGVAHYYGAAEIMKLMQQLALEEHLQQPLNLVPRSQIDYIPKVLGYQLPAYSSELSRRYGNQTVRIEILIDRDGKARFPKILENPVPEMQLALLQSIRVFTFEPPPLPDGTVGVKVVIPIQLQHQDDSYALEDLDSQPVPTFRESISIDYYKIKKVGDVQLWFVIDQNGRIDSKSIRVISSPSQELTDAVIDGVKKWRFKPGIKDGIPVRSAVSQTIVVR